MEKITFDELPQVVEHLINEVAAIKTLVEKQNENNSSGSDLRVPLSIDEACRIVRKSKPTIYRLVGERQIPYSKVGHHLYFYKTDLLDWIAQGKHSTIIEVEEQLSASRNTMPSRTRDNRKL